MRVLVTRPLDDSHRTAQRLAELGHEALVAPLLEIRFLDGPAFELDDVQAVLATSANGVRALARRSARRDIPIFAVGTRTAIAAGAAGFQQIANAQGDAIALATLVRERARPDAGALLHATGADSSPDLRNALIRAGFDVRTEILYEAVAVGSLPEIIRDALENRTLDAVLVFSPRSARILTARLRDAGFLASCERLTACCISEAAAAALDQGAFRAIRIAEHPDEESLLALLEVVARLHDRKNT